MAAPVPARDTARHPMDDTERDTWFAAIQSGDRDTVLERAARTPALLEATGPMGVGPVLHALYAGASALASALLEARGRGPDLHECAALGDVAGLERQLALGPDLGARSGDGFTALHYAAFFGSGPCVRRLLDAGADADLAADNPSRVRPLHAALVRPDAELIGMLLAAGVEVDAPQAGGYTALHSAHRRGDAAVIELLMAAGADPTRRADDGKTPPEMAAP